MMIGDFHQLATAEQTGRSLPEVMDSLPTTAGIDFEPAVLPGAVQGVDLD